METTEEVQAICDLIIQASERMKKLFEEVGLAPHTCYMGILLFNLSDLAQEVKDAQGSLLESDV